MSRRDYLSGTSLLHIIQITPADKGAKSGNGTTAARWAKLLGNLGHQVTTRSTYDGRAADLMIAIHAWRSAEAVVRFKKLSPYRPLILCLAGTDINQFIQTHPEITLRSMELADVLIGLNETVKSLTPRHLRRKIRIIHQSAKPLPSPRQPPERHFNVCVIGHLRSVKDPFRSALAVRDLPETSRIRVRHLGGAEEKGFDKQALAEMKRNLRYNWIGEVPGWRVRQEFARSHLMVISSLAEGGANVVSEAIVAGLPVIASKIDGNVGLLGKGYRGYFPVGDEAELRKLLLRAENDPAFLKTLEEQCAARRDLFLPETEQAALGTLVELSPSP
jgi:putative glycosyltransferase (TIGR04348 family)